MMRVVMEVESGYCSGHKLWLIENQKATVGGSDLADFRLEDRDLADIHFALESSSESCQVVDLPGSPGTYVNGMPIQYRNLYDGDRILAGNTRLRLVVEVSGNRVYSSDVANGGRNRHISGDGYLAALDAGGIPYYYAQPAAPRASAIARLLAGSINLYLIINPRQFAGQLPEGTHAEGRIPLGSAGQYLRLFSLADEVDFFRLLDEAWEQDAVCCLLSQRSPADLMEQIQPVACAYLRPSVLRNQLTSAPTSYALQLLPNVHGVLLPSGDREPWRLYTHPELAPNWQAVGFVEPPSNHLINQTLEI